MQTFRLCLLAALGIAGSAACPAECAAQSVLANPGFEQGAPALTGWNFPASPVYAATLDSVNAHQGRWAARVTGQPGGDANDFGNLYQTVGAAPFRGKRVRYRAW
ncbi:MAG TPA: hypothetical protein VHG08_03325, partial [Longimicrobium sp.]|nr:hypothetical protein [Longimicrobium sp.]